MLCVERRRCVVVGAGPIALRKVRSLRDAGADVLVVAPDAHRVPGVKRSRERFAARHLRGAALVIAATNDPEVNRRVYRAASSRGIPVNVVDVPDLCTFIVPAVIRRGRVVIAISTSGESPMLARSLRLELQRWLPRGLGLLTRRIGQARRALRNAPNRFERRRSLATRRVVRLLRAKGLGAAMDHVARKARP